MNEYLYNDLLNFQIIFGKALRFSFLHNIKSNKKKRHIRANSQDSRKKMFSLNHSIDHEKTEQISNLWPYSINTFPFPLSFLRVFMSTLYVVIELVNSFSFLELNLLETILQRRKGNAGRGKEKKWSEK